MKKVFTPVLISAFSAGILSCGNQQGGPANQKDSTISTTASTVSVK